MDVTNYIDGLSAVKHVLILTGHEEYLDLERYSDLDHVVAALHGYIDGLHASGYLDDNHFMSCFSEIQLVEDHVILHEGEHFDPVDGCDWETDAYYFEVNMCFGYYDSRGWYHSFDSVGV